MEVKSLFDKLKKTKEIISKKKENKKTPQPENVSSQGKSLKSSNLNQGKKAEKQKLSVQNTAKHAGSRKKTTEEGFKVYTEEELGLKAGVGGDTADCPFDCECCV